MSTDPENPATQKDDAKNETPNSNRKETIFGLALCITVVIGLTVGAIVGAGQDDEVATSPTVSPGDNTAGLPVQLTIFHMNDHHSNFEEQDSGVDVADLPSGFPGDLTGVEEIEFFYGGFPRVSALIKKMTQDVKSVNSDQAVLKVHAGDALVGTAFYSLFLGDADAEMMNTVCFDAFALGNHEFDNGDTTLANFVNKLQGSDICGPTPVISANLLPGSDSPLKQLQDAGSISAHTIKTLENGEEVAIVGLTIANKTMFASSPDPGTTIADERETTKREVALLTEKGINKIIVVSHIGYSKDLDWLAEIEGVDVVVGGDSHTLLSSEGDTVGSVQGEYPTTITTDSGDKVCIVQAWEYSKGVGKLDVSFDENGKVISCEGNFYIPYDPVKFEPALDEASAAFMASHIENAFVNLVPVTEDAAALSVFEGFDSQTDALLLTVIADVPKDICFERVPGQGRSTICPVEASASQGGGVCNLVARAFLEESKTADVAIQNAGGCRTDIASGDFTVKSAYTLLPFSNTLVNLDMTGSEIVQVLEEAALNAFGDASSAEYPYEGSTGAYPYAAGLRYNVNAGAAMGSVITDVEVNSRMAGTWVPIEPDTVYTVVTNSFVAKGRDGYITFGDIAEELVTDTYIEYAQAFIDYTNSVGSLNDLSLDEYSTKVFSRS